MPVRRVAEVGRISPDSVDKWTKNSRNVPKEAVDLGVEGRIRAAY